MLGALPSTVDLFFKLQYGVYREWYSHATEQIPAVYRSIFIVLDADGFTLCGLGFFAIGFSLLIRWRPRLAALSLLGIAVVGGLEEPLRFTDALTALQPYGLLDHDMSLSPLMGNLGFCVLLGLVPLMALAIAEELDRASVSRTADRIVGQSSEGPAELYRRACRHRALIATVSGGALRPWMAVARILPVAMLPAVFALGCARLYPQLLYTEVQLSMPALATDANPGPSENPRVRITLDANWNVGVGTTELSLRGEAWNSAVQRFKELRAQSPATTFIELEVAPDVEFDRIVDLLSALYEANFWKIVFVDEAA